MKWEGFEKDGYIKLNDLADFYEAKAKLYKTTQGYQMVRNFVLDQVLSEEFQGKVREIRKKYSVPELGFEYPGSETMDVAYFPAGRFVSPREWSAEHTEDLNKNIKELATSWGLHPNGWYEFFMNYLLYDEVIIPDYPEINLCFVKEIREDDDEIVEWQVDDDKYFPISIRISPYASKRVILDYIEKLYATEIYPLQSLLNVNNPSKLGKKRKKKTEVQIRNGLIWQLHQKGSTPKDILTALISVTGDSPDEAAIRKIISLQKKKRT